MIVLDTNVLSEFLRPAPDERVIAWLDAQPKTDVATTAVTVFEMLYGVARLPDGLHRRRLGRAIAQQLTAFDGRVLAFDAAAAAHTAALSAARRLAGRRIGAQDAQIAGIARSRGVMLATRNTKDFGETGVDVVDPWAG